MTERAPYSVPEKDRTFAKNNQLLAPEEFRADFCDEVDDAVLQAPSREENLVLPEGERPELGHQAMWVELYGKNQKEIFKSMHSSAKAGFKVEEHRDWFSETTLDNVYKFLPPSIPNFFRAIGAKGRFLLDKARGTHRMFVSGFHKARTQMLEKAGAQVTTMNTPKNIIDRVLFLAYGRDHRKISYVKTLQKKVAWFGGMNSAEEHFKRHDFMVKVDDPDTVDALIKEFKRIEDKKRIEDAEIPINKETTLLSATGKEESIILQHAIKDIDNATESVYVSSGFTPSGKFIDAIDRAKQRGVQVAYIATNPEKRGLIEKWYARWTDLWSRRKARIPLLFPERRSVHAKALVVDKKIATFGSDNFKEIKHEELSMRSTNPDLVQNILSFLHRVSGGNLDKKLQGDFIVPEPA